MNSRILIIPVVVIIFLALFWIIGGDLVELLRNISPAWLALTGACWISSFVIRGVRWKILLSPIGKPVSFSSSFWSISMSYLVNFIVPTKWGSEVVRAVALGKKENISFFPTLSSIAVEKVLDLLTMVALASVALVFLPALDLVPEWIFYILKVLALLTVVLMAVLFILSWKMKYLIEKLKVYKNLFGRVSRAFVTMLSALVNGIGWVVKNPLPFLHSLGLTFILWFIFSLGVYGIFLSIGITPEPLSILLGTLLFSFAYILPNVPGYVGTYEGMWLLIFLGLGVGSGQIVLAGALVGHLVSTGIIVSLGSIGLIKAGLNLTESLRSRSHHKELQRSETL